MSDLFYSAVHLLGSHVFWLSGRPIVIGAQHTRLPGAFILAATHESAYDVPLLIYHSARHLDFLTTTEAISRPLVKWFYSSMNAFPLDRSKRDTAGARAIIKHLERGRAVALFPEGRLRRGEASVVHTGKMRSGVGRIARLANAPIIPCALVNSAAYSKATRWLPIRKAVYGIGFGSPIQPLESDEQTEAEVINSFVSLHKQLVDRLKPNGI